MLLKSLKMFKLSETSVTNVDSKYIINYNEFAKKQFDYHYSTRVSNKFTHFTYQGVF